MFLDFLQQYPFILAFILGFVPALVWLWFWLTEDRDHPEPKRMIALAFFVGCLTVLLVLPFQKVAFQTIASGLPLIIALAIIEDFYDYCMERN